MSNSLGGLLSSDDKAIKDEAKKVEEEMGSIEKTAESLVDEGKKVEKAAKAVAQEAEDAKKETQHMEKQLEEKTKDSAETTTASSFSSMSKLHVDPKSNEGSKSHGGSNSTEDKTDTDTDDDDNDDDSSVERTLGQTESKPTSAGTSSFSSRKKHPETKIVKTTKEEIHEHKKPSKSKFISLTTETTDTDLSSPAESSFLALKRRALSSHASNAEGHKHGHKKHHHRRHRRHRKRRPGFLEEGRLDCPGDHHPQTKKYPSSAQFIELTRDDILDSDGLDMMNEDGNNVNIEDPSLIEETMDNEEAVW